MSDNGKLNKPVELAAAIAEGYVGRIYVAQPQYFGGVPASHRQFWRGGGSKCKMCSLVDGGGSLLANVFNQFWVHALNLQESGERITHFAMLHDDVVPQDGWLDQLISDLLEYNTDVMSAVVPIKDGMGLTSCAIDSDDPFIVLRRITMTEVFNLPEVFGAEDCGYPPGSLLVNTGCWVCDFTKPWRNALDEYGNLRIAFTINDRVRHIVGAPGEDGKPKTQWVAEVSPEDWNFSRAVQKLGAKVMATRRVSLSHYGWLPYSNAEPWGTCEQDRLLAHRHGGKPIVKPGYEYLNVSVNDVAGWLTEDEGRALARLAQKKTVLEIGSYCGKSTIYMARTADCVFTVDTFDGMGTQDKRDTLPDFRRNLLKYGVLGQVRIHKGKSREIVPKITQSFFDLAFIDGSHDYTSVNEDIDLCLKAVKPDGLIALHDYGHTPDHGVMAAVNNRLGVDLEMVEQPGTIIVVKRLKTAVKGERTHSAPATVTVVSSVD